MPRDPKALRRELYERIDRGDIGLIEAIRMARKVTGLTQADYARLVGLAPRTLIDLERGVGNPTLATFEKVLAPFNLELTVRRRPRPT